MAVSSSYTFPSKVSNPYWLEPIEVVKPLRLYLTLLNSRGMGTRRSLQFGVPSRHVPTGPVGVVFASAGATLGASVGSAVVELPCLLCRLVLEGALAPRDDEDGALRGLLVAPRERPIGRHDLLCSSFSRSSSVFGIACEIVLGSISICFVF